ncbi:MAG: BglG family transcription antiterminator [Liquorilactobacillus nagelii]|uniref:BglG family transcription antiterminator n=3 Tax=Liquorilactobacillus nagelii TaxID=82688 RepID=UPI0039E84CF4
MKSRTWKILGILLDTTNYQAFTTFQLAQQFDVSKRTILNDLNELKEFLASYSVSLKYQSNFGYSLEGRNGDLLRVKNSLNSTTASLTAKTRRQQIMIGLLLSKKITSINELSDKYHVSRSSIVRDFKIIKQDLAQQGLDLVSDFQGTRITGNETLIRETLRQQIKEYQPLNSHQPLKMKPDDSKLDSAAYTRLVGVFSKNTISRAERALTKFEQQAQFNLTDIMYLNMITHILIIINRNVHLKEKDLQIQVGQLEGNMALLSENLNQSFPGVFKFNDIQYLGQHLFMSGIQDSVKPALLMDYLRQFDNGAKSFARDLIKQISDLLKVDLTSDQELYLNLRSHCLAMFERLKNHQKIKNPLLNQIKQNYSALFGIVVLGISELYVSQDLNLESLPETEVGFLVIHFQASLEKNIKMKKIIIVCPEGVGFSRLIQNKINSILPLVKVKNIVPYKDIGRYNLTGIDFIVSTIQFKCAVPVIQVSGFLDENDINRLNTFVIQHAKEQTPNLMINLIDKCCVFPQQHFQNKEQVIEFLTNSLLELDMINQNFVDSVKERENVMATEIGNGVAIPHGSSELVKVPKIGVVTLNRPIIWGKGMVDIIFLLALKFENSLQNKNAINSLYYLVNSKKLLQDLRYAKTKNELYGVLTINPIK